MQTTLKPGDIFVTRDRGGYSAWKVADNGIHYSGVGRPLKAGETVHFAVWKGDRIEPRKSYVLKDGDVTWQSSGHLTLKRMTERQQAYSTQQQMGDMMNFMTDLMSGKSVTLPKIPYQQYPETEENFVFVNRFGGKCPAWLRDAR